MKKVRILGIVLMCVLLVCGCAKKDDVSASTSSTTAAVTESKESTDTTSETQEPISTDYSEDDGNSDVIADWTDEETTTAYTTSVSSYDSFDWDSIPEYMGTDVIEINNDIPMFTEEEEAYYTGTYIELSELDSLGRCGVAKACLGQETRADEERGDISKVYPSGWVQKKYGTTWLYNRSHLLMFALTGLNDDNRNLITGTEYFNQTLMLGYESMALSVVDNMNAHVLYRVTPVFEGDNLVAKGVLMECYCIEYPEDCTFCVFVYNVEPGVKIDYATGNSTEA